MIKCHDIIYKGFAKTGVVYSSDRDLCMSMSTERMIRQKDNLYRNEKVVAFQWPFFRNKAAIKSNSHNCQPESSQ